ncbi:potassium transporter [Amedibacterium intestinale]|uniref:Potassium transporter n=1 Tax=Amedibacterium intestinale TaxID=2583452 RepID=A0A6N4TH84_9FIRM|nr:TrkH family potassium uptake protein [Amedibacterium intestinale]BBK22360.1 potassium transporter [Amedibacterium intestinale]
MKLAFKYGNHYGKLAVIIGVLIAVPILILPFYPDEVKYIPSFLIPSILSIAFGFFLCKYLHVKQSQGGFRDNLRVGSFAVLFAWVYGITMGALPFVLSGLLNPIQAVFEAVSGWTTTGLSVMDVEATPYIFLFHRGFMQFCGGLGFLMMMIIFVQGKQAMALYSAEGHPDKLLPNIRKTAQTICIMYCGFLVVGVLMYLVCGMNLFDSIIHTMCSLSTGGFSTRADSIGYYDSPAIEAVTIVQMLVGTTNFAALLLLTKGKIMQFIKVSEVRFLFMLLIVFVPVTAFILTYGLYVNLAEGLRLSLFNIVSALSTTGYSTMPYQDWPQAALGIMIIMMLIGGGIGSTAGGLKLTRIYIMLRSTIDDIRMRLKPARSIRKITYITAHGKEEVDDRLLKNTSSFFVCYLVLFCIGTIAVSITANCDLTSAMFDFASSLGTVGLSIGITGPATNMATLIVEIIGMFMGRLEIFIVFIGVHELYSYARSFIRLKWKK